jgi:hypothetical protein
MSKNYPVKTLGERVPTPFHLSVPLSFIFIAVDRFEGRVNPPQLNAERLGKRKY